MRKTFRQWFVAKPMAGGVLALEQFELRELPIPDLEDGQALVRVKLVNIHGGTRANMAKGWISVGETSRGNFACAEVIRSRDKAFKEGDIIACQAGWQDYQVVSSGDRPFGYSTPSEMVKTLNGTNSQWAYVFRPSMVKMWSPEVLLDMLGTSGLTAYFGMRECGPLTPGDRVAVAGATGSVGSIVAQLAKASGCHVIGFAGGADRCAWVVETLGIDGCLDYKAPDFEAQIGAAFPDGVDVFSDGVGGPLTQTMTAIMNHNSRLFAYGGASAFHADKADQPAAQPPSMRRMFGLSDAVEEVLKEKNIKSECWIVDEFYHERLRAEEELSRLMRKGALTHINNVVEGLENLPAAIVSLNETGRPGKLQVRFEPPAIHH
jgi:hypothetical protein